MRHKIGDKVTIRKDLLADKFYGEAKIYCNEDMARRAGEVVTIREYNGKHRCKIKEDAYDWTWCDEMFEEMGDEKDDPVSNPSHYTGNGRIQPIKFIQDKNLNFARGNVVKYVTRAGHKPEGDKKQELEDLRKARQYLDFEINHLEGRV